VSRYYVKREAVDGEILALSAAADGDDIAGGGLEVSKFSGKGVCYAAGVG
jgi:hypothetical protein